MTQDLEPFYDERIAPLMAQVIEACREVGMPFFASFQYGPDDLCTSAQLPSGCAAELEAAYRALFPPALRMQTRDGQGNVLTDSVILP